MGDKPRIRVRDRVRTIKADAMDKAISSAGFKLRRKMGVDGPILSSKKADFLKHKKDPNVSVGTKANTLTDNNGMVQMPDVPAEPKPGQTKGEWEEQKVAQAEQLMLQGIREPHLIQHYLKLNSIEHSNSIIRRVKARWEAVGTVNNSKEFRGEMLSHLERLTQQIWVMYAREGNTLNEKCYCATLLLRLFDQRMTLYGLSQDTIQQVLIMTEDSEVMSKIKTQRKMADMAARLTDKIIARRERMGTVVDVEDEENE